MRTPRMLCAVALLAGLASGLGATPDALGRPVSRNDDEVRGADVSLPEAVLHAVALPGAESVAALDGAARGDLSLRVMRFVRLARGLARHHLGRYRAATTDLAAVAADADAPLGDLAAFFEAESWFHQGRYARAGAGYSAIVDHRPWSHWVHRARMRLVDVDVAQGKPATALKALGANLERYPEYPHPVAARIVRGDAERAREHLTAAAEAYEQAVDGWPGDPVTAHARARLQALAEVGITPKVDAIPIRLNRGVDLRRRKYFDEALALLRGIVADDAATSAQRFQARIQIGRTLFQMERLAEARDHFAALEADASGSVQRTAAYWRAQVLEQLGETEAAVQAFLASQRNPDRLDAEATDKVAWIYFNGAKYPQATEWFYKTQAFGGVWRGRTAFWRVWSAYRGADYAAALKGFKALAGGSRRRSDRYDYWIGRTLANQGQVEAAIDTWRGVVSSSPLSYYAYQAKARIAEFGGVLDPEREGPSDPDAESEPEAEGDPESAGCANGETCEPVAAERVPQVAPLPEDDILLADAPMPAAPGADLAAMPEVPAAPEAAAPEATAPEALDDLQSLRRLVTTYGGTLPRLAAAYELALVGERDQAAWALREVRDEWIAFRRASRGERRRWRYLHKPFVDYRKDTDVGAWGSPRVNGDGPLADDAKKALLAKPMPKAFQADLKRAFAEVDDHFYFRRMGGGGKLRTPPEAPANNPKWRQHYPRAFERLVEGKAAAKGLDPHFIWALMTVESSYNPWAISRVGARGLMQVMPHTGALVAERMGLQNFGTPALFEPEVVIEQAAWYFAALLKKFNGQLPLAIASYNAGPHRVAAWLSRKGHLPMDEFIEEMPYTEAREYTKKVLRYLALYRRIYLGAANLTVSQVVDPDFNDNINF